MDAIEFRDVVFRHGPTAPPVLDGVSFTVRRGETLVLLGCSGGGKTTALRLINALLLPTAGAVVVEGRATTTWDRILLRRRTGYVLQDAGLFPHFTVARNIAVVPSIEGWAVERIAARVDELLRVVGLPAAQFADRFPAALSGGQRQRVAVARALAADPPLLLLDEPFGALDPLTRATLQREFVAIVRRLGKTSVFVTHDLREALLVGDRIALLDAGRLALLESPAGFLASPHPLAVAYRETLAFAPIGSPA